MITEAWGHTGFYDPLLAIMGIRVVLGLQLERCPDYNGVPVGNIYITKILFIAPFPGMRWAEKQDCLGFYTSADSWTRPQSPGLTTRFGEG